MEIYTGGDTVVFTNMKRKMLKIIYWQRMVGEEYLLRSELKT